MIRSVVTLGFVLFLAGCLGGYPLGMSEKEWLELTPDQRVEARAKQSEIDEMRQARLAEAARIERERIEQLYAEGKLGDVLQCTLDGGDVHFPSILAKPAPLAFRMARGEKKYVVLEQSGGIGRLQLWAEFAQNGLQLKICPSAQGPYLAAECATFVAISRDFAAGKSWQLDMKNVVVGAALRCGFPAGRKLKGQPLPST